MTPTFMDRDLSGPTSYKMGDPTSQSYYDTSVGLQKRAMQPAYEQALDRMRGSFASRGFAGGGGMEKFAEMGMSQDYMGRLGDYAGKAALRASDVGEENRRRVETRGWQVEDRDLRYKKLQEQEQRMREDKEAAARSGLIGGIGRGVGMVGGALIGAYAGGPMGAMYGANLGSQLMGGGGAQMPAYPSPYQGVDPGYDPEMDSWLMDQYAPAPDMGYGEQPLPYWE